MRIGNCGAITMKKILFVINTMGRAGAERSLIELLKKMDGEKDEISLYVLMGQGELITEVPSYVKIRNPVFSTQSVLSKTGRTELLKTVFKSFFKNGRWLKKTGYITRNFLDMLKKRKIQKDKLFWRVLADGAMRFDEDFDLAVAWLEGGSAYYVSDYVRSKRKVAFIHIDYEKAGYTRAMDRNCWDSFDRIFAVSENVKEKFLKIYPKYKRKIYVFQNIINQEYIRCRSKEPGGFSDRYTGKRILTVGRLTYQKGYDIAIEAMKLLKESDCQVKWYVLGEGEERKNLEKKIDELGLEDDFYLLGAVENPYPYFVQADLYVHPARYEGQCVVVHEAQTLGCAVIVSDYCGNQEQIENGKYGISCALTPQAVAESIRILLEDDKRRLELGIRAGTKKMPEGQEKLLYELLT